MPDLQLQPSIASDLRSQGMRAIVERLEQLGTPHGAIDATQLLCYWINSTPPVPPDSVLPYLVWQFDINSPFWGLLASASGGPSPALRDLLVTSISLHARRGLPQTIIDVVKRLGYTDAHLLEGQNSWGGSDYPPDQGWAVYRIFVDLSLPLDPSPPSFLFWNATTAYAPGDVVAYPLALQNTPSPPPGNVTAGWRYFRAMGSPPVGVPPWYFLVSDVLDIADITDFSTLRTRFWIDVPYINGVPYRPLLPSDVALLRAVCEFFQPERCYLDEIIGGIPGPSDVILINDQEGMNVSDTILITDAPAGTGPSDLISVQA